MDNTEASAPQTLSQPEKRVTKERDDPKKTRKQSVHPGAVSARKKHRAMAIADCAAEHDRTLAVSPKRL